MIKVAFYKGKGNWIDWCIRFWTRSIYSHVELVFIPNDGSMVRLLSSSQRDRGVRYKMIPRKYFKPENWLLIDASTMIDIHALHEFYIQRHGYKYDLKGILLSQFLPLKRHSKQRYFCSEFCAEALGFSNPHEYSPQDLYTALQPRG